jgi:flagellar hook assembly protein FlgD
VRAYPNPFSNGTAFTVQLAAPATVDLAVYDNNGRLVKSVARGRSVTTQAVFPWDGCDEQGRSVAPGIYFYRAGSTVGEAWGKVVLSR